MKITVDFQPLGRKIEVDENTTVLQAAQKAGIGLTAVCGGQTACGSCLVHLKRNYRVSLPSATEQKRISTADLNSGMRLACQTQLFESVVVDLPPESLTAMQRTQVEGVETSFVADPTVSCHHITFSGHQQTSTQSDWENLCHQLGKTGSYRLKHASLNMLQQLPLILRAHNWNVKVVLQDERLVAILGADEPVLGLAVDIGTTKIAAYLIDLSTGITLIKKGAMNPQISYGEDIMARIALVMNERPAGKELQTTLVETINDLTRNMCHEFNKQPSDPASKQNLSPSQITDMVIVGNTAMHHIFLGLPVSQLGVAPYLLATSEALNVPACDMGIKGSPGANIHLLPNVAGFVGADHVAMLLAADINGEAKTTLYVDIGTNTEITLKHKNRMISCSAASGPAFEGAHIRDGMRAAPGAIERVQIDGLNIRYQTIGDGKPIGICGSGILDAVAEMLHAGIIDRHGKFYRQHPLVVDRKALVIAPQSETRHGRSIAITRKDISEIQLAKGAIRAAIDLLLKEIGLGFADIASIKIAGAFGTYINLESAKTLGLFPHLGKAHFQQLGNAAGMGAKQALLSAPKRREAQAIALDIDYLELSAHPEFPALFIEAMQFAT